jgi:hypothetical protein
VRRSATTDHWGFSFEVGADEERVLLSIFYSDEVAPEQHRIWFERANFIRMIVSSVENLEWSADERAAIVRAASGGFVDAERRGRFEGPS